MRTAWMCNTSVHTSRCLGETPPDPLDGGSHQRHRHDADDDAERGEGGAELVRDGPRASHEDPVAFPAVHRISQRLD